MNNSYIQGVHNGLDILKNEVSITRACHTWFAKKNCDRFFGAHSSSWEQWVVLLLECRNDRGQHYQIRYVKIYLSFSRIHVREPLGDAVIHTKIVIRYYNYIKKISYIYNYLHYNLYIFTLYTIFIKHYCLLDLHYNLYLQRVDREYFYVILYLRNTYDYCATVHMALT